MLLLFKRVKSREKTQKRACRHQRKLYSSTTHKNSTKKMANPLKNKSCLLLFLHHLRLMTQTGHSNANLFLMMALEEMMLVFVACVGWSVVEQTTTVTVPPYPFADAYLPAMARTGLASEQ